MKNVFYIIKIYELSSSAIAPLGGSFFFPGNLLDLHTRTAFLKLQSWTFIEYFGCPYNIARYKIWCGAQKPWNLARLMRMVNKRLASQV
jgi:hypothetical protein